MSTEVKVRMLTNDELKRGPGGNWFYYEATDGKAKGYGQTAMEAKRDLEKINGN